MKESEESSTIKGYSFNLKSCSSSDSNCMTEIWTIPFENQKLIAHSSNHIHAHKGINLNGAILFKYLEPTLFALATAPTNGNNEMFIYIIEGSTGRVVHQSYERNVLLNKPITLMLDENSLIASFQRIGKLGEGVQQFQSISFYEQDIKFSARDIIVDYITGKNMTQIYGEMPIVVQNAYIFQQPVKSFGVTNTAQGITGKNLLLVLENDQIYSLRKFDSDTAMYLRKLSKLAKERHENQQKEAFDHSIIDSLDLDMEDQMVDEEGQVVQMIDSFLPFNPQLIITHKHELIGLEKVISAPSRLESTSLTLSYGLDIFYTTVAPEKQFDILDEDFRKDYLIMTILGLIVMSKVFDWYFTKKKLTAKIHTE